MPLKKFKPRQPDPLIGKIKGDNELARLAHLNHLIDQLNAVLSNVYSREIHNLPVPALDDVVNITTTSIDTVIRFTDTLVDNFTINVTAGPNVQPGDRVYIFVNGNATVFFGGDLNNITCGGSSNDYTSEGGETICLEMVFDGTMFSGVDNC